MICIILVVDIGRGQGCTHKVYSQAPCRVCTGHGKPGKSWNFKISFSRPEKSWNFCGSWKVMENYVDLYKINYLSSFFLQNNRNQK